MVSLISAWRTLYPGCLQGVEVFGDEYEEEEDTGYKPGTLDIPLTIGMIQNMLL